MIEAIKKLGCEELPRRGGGSHGKWLNPANGRVAVLPDWGGRDLKLGTVRPFLHQLELDLDRFREA